MDRRTFLQFAAAMMAPIPAIGKTDGLVSGYSQRRLFAGYSGPLFRVRRSSDNSELDVFPGTDVESFAREGDEFFVCAMYDQSGNNSPPLLIEAAARQPKFSIN